MLIETTLERFTTRVNHQIERVIFDPTNPEHRLAAMQFFKYGVWKIKFHARWPCVTVPQTVLMSLAEFACQEELETLAKADNVEFSVGDPFNLHTLQAEKHRRQLGLQ